MRRMARREAIRSLLDGPQGSLDAICDLLESELEKAYSELEQAQDNLEIRRAQGRLAEARKLLNILKPKGRLENE